MSQQMKIGVSRISNTPEEAVEVLVEARRIGFEGVQIKTNQLRAWDFSYDRFRTACGEAASLSRGGIVFHPGTDYTTWPTNTDRVLAFARAGGAEHVCYCFCPSCDESGSFDKAIDMLKRAGERFAEIGIPFSLHNHTGSVFHGVDDLLRAADHLDPKICGLTFDTAHAHKCGITDMAGAIRRLAHAINNVHLKDVRADGSFCPIGQGVMDLPPLIESLRDIGYHQWLVVDEESKDFDTPAALEASMQFLRGKL